MLDEIRIRQRILKLERSKVIIPDISEDDFILQATFSFFVNYYELLLYNSCAATLEMGLIANANSKGLGETARLRAASPGPSLIAYAINRLRRSFEIWVQ